MADQDNAGIVPINTRSPAQWAALNNALDWRSRAVLDVGCGYGDLLLFAEQAGASVFGIDQDPEIAMAARDRGLWVLCTDLNEYMERSKDHYDVVFCFSVLPYVFGKDRTLDNLAQIADIAFIEVQLYGDGPGFFVDEDELRETLLEHWHKVTRIGETVVKIRNTIRAIWMCEDAIERGKMA